MKLPKLEKRIKKAFQKKRKGKEVAKLLRRLVAKEKEYKKARVREKSKKEQKRLDLNLRVVRAHVKKARKLLNELNA